MNIIVKTLQSLVSDPHEGKSLYMCDKLPWGVVFISPQKKLHIHIRCQKVDKLPVFTLCVKVTTKIDIEFDVANKVSALLVLC